jgi:hypothetical protein
MYMCEQHEYCPFVRPKIRTETGKKTFAYQGAIILNKLPSDLKRESSLLRFKSSWKCFNFDSLICTYLSHFIYFILFLDNNIALCNISNIVFFNST